MAPARASGINPRAVLVDRGGMQLIENRQFKPVRQVTLPLQLPQKLLDHISRDDDDNDRLQAVISLRQYLNTPGDLGHGHG